MLLLMKKMSLVMGIEKAYLMLWGCNPNCFIILYNSNFVGMNHFDWSIHKNN